MSYPPLQPATPRRLLLALFVSSIFLGPLLAGAGAQDGRPSLEEGIEAWLMARSFVDELHAPTSERTTPEDAGPDIAGASVVIRFRGRIIGIGDSHFAGEDTLRQALDTAVRDARASNRVRDLPYDMIESVGRGSTMELELAGEPIPLLGKTLEEAASVIRPGIDGIAVRRGERWRWSFPARMHAFGQADRPERVLIRLMRDLGLPPRDPAELRRIDDVEFYRFEVLCLAQLDPDSTPFESIRGGAVVHANTPLKELASNIAADAAENIEAHLAVDPDVPVGEIPGSERLSAIGLFGNYDLARDSFKPMVAPSADQALTAWALATYAHNAPDLDEERRVQLLRLASLILERLSMVDSVEEQPFADPKTAALVVLAGLEFNQASALIGATSEDPEIVTQAKDELLRQLELEPSFEGDDANSVVALRHLAVTRLVNAQAVSLDAERLSQLREEAWRRPTAEHLVGSLHLLLMAEPSQADDPGAAARWEAAQHAIDASIASQVAHPDSLVAKEDPVGDLSGGFVLAGSRRVTATASSLRPALAIAIALGEEHASELDPTRRVRWEHARALALRFTRQLQVHSGMLYRAAAPERAIGGVKNAPWSNTVSLADTALALLLAAEVLQDRPG